MSSTHFHDATAIVRHSMTTRLAGLARQVLTSLDRWQRRRQALRQLYSVDARTLKDIGMSRAEVTSVVYGGGEGRRRSHSET